MRDAPSIQGFRRVSVQRVSDPGELQDDFVPGVVTVQVMVLPNPNANKHRQTPGVLLAGGSSCRLMAQLHVAFVCLACHADPVADVRYDMLGFSLGCLRRVLHAGVYTSAS